MARVLSRREFYDLVWSKPITHLAKDFAVSDAALHKICLKHDVPKPPMGWWTRKAMGQELPTPTCPPAKPGTSEQITIIGGMQQPAFATAARERAKNAVETQNATVDSAPHPIVRLTMAKLRKAKPSPIGSVSVGGQGLLKAEVAAGSIDRLEAILTQLAMAAKAQGFRLVAGDGPAHFSNGTDTIDISVSELTERDKHVLTEDEEAKEAAWVARREREMKTKPWLSLEFGRPKFPDWDYRLTGRLSVELERVFVWDGGSPRRTFRDAKVQRLENMIGDIAVAIAVLAAAKLAERQRRAEQEQRFEEQKQRRELDARVKHVEDRRAATLTAVLAETVELERLRDQVEVLARTMADEPSPRVARFLAWSRNHLAEREALLSLESLEHRFVQDRIFGDDDDFGFRPTRY